MTESEEKKEESRGDVSPHTSDAHSTSQKDKQSSYDSGDIRRLIAKGLRPSPSQVSAAERDNPFPKFDLNKGWNRASLQGVKQFFAGKPSISNNKIAQDFARLSLKAQQHLLPVCPDLEKLFTFIFKRTGPVNKPLHICRSLVLSRRTLQPITTTLPPTWFQTRSYNLSDFTADVLGNQVFLFDLSPETISEFCKYVCELVPRRGERKRNFHLANLSTAKTYLSEKRQCLNLGGQQIRI